MLNDAGGDWRVKASRWIRDEVRKGATPVVRQHDVQFFDLLSPLSVTEQVNRLITYLVEKTKHFRQSLDYYKWPELQAILEIFQSREIVFLGEYLIERRFVRIDPRTQDAIVTVEGFAYAETIGTKSIASKQAFVAMWFNPDLNSVWTDGLARGVENAGYTALRIDGKQHNHKICDEIISEIRRSRFLVADFTGHRGGVYYEAGFAAGLGIPVIFACRKDAMKELHFDIRQYNTIDWAEIPELAERLEARICATIGDGPQRKISGS